MACTRETRDTLISKIPQLIGMDPGPVHVNNVIQSSAPASCSCKTRAILGLNWQYPTPPARPPTSVEFKYWDRESYTGRIIRGGGKGGQHDASENVGQTFIEDENGDVIDGYVAKDIRDMLGSLFQSLVWSGQATPNSKSLPHEARVYVHVSLAHHFPFLLLCAGGRWKINELIMQAYSSFADSAQLRAPRHTSRSNKGKAVAKPSPALTLPIADQQLLTIAQNSAPSNVTGAGTTSPVPSQGMFLPSESSLEHTLTRTPPCSRVYATSNFDYVQYFISL